MTEMTSIADAPGTAVRYEYRALDSRSHIRLITLHPKSSNGVNDHVINIELTQHLIGECPRYEALSYTWGDRRQAQEIVVQPSQTCIEVTGNLHAGLLSLRQRKHRKLWIDAICINQDDIEERSTQVRLMSQIYSNAKNVVVWLHQPDESRDDASKWFIVKKPGPEDYHSDGKGGWTRIHREQKDYPTVEFPDYALRLFRHPWFLRVWILQEIAFAKHVFIRYGRRTIYWDEVIEWVGNYTDRATDSRNTKIDETTELAIAMQFIMNDWRHSVSQNLYHVPLIDLLHLSRFSGATEPKDKVFALLSLACDVDDTFETNYQWSWPKICTGLTTRSIRNSRALGLLRAVGTLSSTPNTALLPSWVPDLSGQFEATPLEPYNNLTLYRQHPDDRPCEIPVLNEKTIVVKCLWILDVAQVQEPRLRFEDEGGHRALLSLLKAWFGAALEHRDHYAKYSSVMVDFATAEGLPLSEADQERKDLRSTSVRNILHEFWSTMRMTKSSRASEEHIDNPYSAGEGWHWHFRKILHQGHVGKSQPEDPFNPDNEIEPEDLFDANDDEIWFSDWARSVVFPPTALQHLYGRTFGFTKAGHMGLFPGDTRVGDRICLVYGTQLPYVLRETEDEGLYHLVGACYVHQAFKWDVFESESSKQQLQYIRLE